MRQQQRERQHAEDRSPDHVLATDAIAQRPAEDRARGDGAEKHEEVQLRALDRDVKSIDEVERVEGAETREVDVLREHEHEQHRDRGGHLAAREVMERRVVAAVRAAAGAHVVAVPDADLPEHDHRRQRGDRKPGQAALPVLEHDESRQQRPERRPRVAADLEERLREAVLSSGCQPGDARRLRMEDRRADADQRGGREHCREMVGPRQEQQPRQRESHADGQRLRLRLAIREIADHRLEERRGELVGERDQADVPEVEGERGLEDRIDRRQQRLTMSDR